MRNAGFVIDIISVKVFILCKCTLNSFSGRTGDLDFVIHLGIASFLNSFSSRTAFAVKSPLPLSNLALQFCFPWLMFLIFTESLVSSLVISSQTLMSSPDMPPLLTVKLVVSLSSVFIDIFDLVEALTLGRGISNGLLSSFLLAEIADFNMFCCFLLAEIDKAEINKGLLSD